MMTRSYLRQLVALVCVIPAALLCGCEKPLDSPEYGEIIYQVPQELNRSVPLPELNEPGESPLAGPESSAAPKTPVEAAKSPENQPAAAEPASAPDK